MSLCSSQDRSGMKIITLTKQGSSQVGPEKQHAIPCMHILCLLYLFILFLFSDQLTTNTMSALHDCLLLSGCLLSLLSCPDKNKHGKISTY